MTITYLGHSCFALESGGYRVVIDPYEGVDGYPVLQTEAHAVYTSHSHFDHHCLAAVRLLPGGESPFAVTAVKTFHDGRRGALRGENTVRIFAADGVRVAHLGDLGHPLTAEQLAAIGRVDVLLLPVGGTYTLDPAGAKRTADAVGAPTVVPMHYRRGSLGFGVLATAEEFCALYPPEQVHVLDTAVFPAVRAASLQVLLPRFGKASGV